MSSEQIIKIEEIKINLGDKGFVVLTLDEAKQLYESLRKLFEQNGPNIPVTYPIIYPPYNPYIEPLKPYYGRYEITCKTEQGFPEDIK